MAATRARVLAATAGRARTQLRLPGCRAFSPWPNVVHAHSPPPPRCHAHMQAAAFFGVQPTFWQAHVGHDVMLDAGWHQVAQGLLAWLGGLVARTDKGGGPPQAAAAAAEAPAAA